MSEKNCILVVDDDEGVRKSLTLILRKKGYLVESAATGKEALAIAQGRSVSLTLLDVKLPDIMGTQLLAPLKQTNPDMSVIMITGFASVENAVQSLTAGASGYITKPIDLDGMLARIKTALDQQHLVAEVRRAEDALRESEEKFRGIFDTINDGIHIHEIEPDGKPGKFIEVNEIACRMLQYTREELMGLGPLDIVSGYHSRPFDDIIGELSTTGHAIFETEHRRKDGSIVPVEINAHVVNLQGKRMTVSAIRDITERKQAENAIALTTRKLALMNDVTYQFIQNKVTALRGYAELSKDAKTEAERVSFIEKEERILADIHLLIKNSKDYQEMRVNQPRWIPVEQSIWIAVSLVSPNPDISIEITLHGLELYADPIIEKIFSNLIENAEIHGKTTTRIRFSCEETPEEFILICEDDGVGISPDVKVRLFDRGFSGNARFGLFFIDECLTLSGMTIAETGEPGKGARFEIHIPKEFIRFPIG